MTTDKRTGEAEISKRARRFGAAALWASFLFLAIFPQTKDISAADKSVAWKPADQPMLRVDDRPVTDWNVYLAAKKNNPLLVEMGKRFLLIDQQKRQIFELDPAKVEHRGTDLYWDPTDRPEKPLETSGWLVRDVGLAYRVSAKLVAEDHVIDVQIPHPLDLKKVGP